VNHVSFHSRPSLLAPSQKFVRGLLATTAESDFSPSAVAGFGFRFSPARTADAQHPRPQPDLPFPGKERTFKPGSPAMPGAPPLAVPQRLVMPASLAGVRGQVTIGISPLTPGGCGVAAQYPARTIPCRRLARRSRNLAYRAGRCGSSVFRSRHMHPLRRAPRISNRGPVVRPNGTIRRRRNTGPEQPPAVTVSPHPGPL
jgi:hypothetical protein